jgi:hypothetical protein
MNLPSLSRPVNRNQIVSKNNFNGVTPSGTGCTLCCTACKYVPWYAKWACKQACRIGGCSC